jgi:predicted sulfurtransferase
MRLSALFVLACMMLGALGTAHAAEEAARGGYYIITTEELAKMIDDPSVLVIDVRTGTDWRASEFKIKGARRLDATVIDIWDPPMDRKIVIYCA